jgi:hypothetical protein
LVAARDAITTTLRATAHHAAKFLEPMVRSAIAHRDEVEHI